MERGCSDVGRGRGRAKPSGFRGEAAALKRCPEMHLIISFGSIVTRQESMRFCGVSEYLFEEVHIVPNKYGRLTTTSRVDQDRDLRGA